MVEGLKREALEYHQNIEPFLIAATSVLQSMLGLTLETGELHEKTREFQEGYLVISIGITGDITGQVLIVLRTEVACDIASKMCMMEIRELDELSISALSELSNMILGNAATVLSTKNLSVDITTPTIMHGDFIMESVCSNNLSVTLCYEGTKEIELDMALKEGEKC